MAKGLAYLLFRYNKKRVAVARRNIELCFPEKTAEEQSQLLQENIFSTAMALFETGIAWFWPKWRLRRIYQIEGLEHIRSAQASGHGVLLIGMHFTTIDIMGAILGDNVSFDAMYRHHKNEFYDYWQKRMRENNSADNRLFVRANPRALVSALKKKRVVWYAPDEDLGREGSVFVPFFNVPAATLTATARFAKLGKASVVALSHHRLDAGKGYKVIAHPPMENYPSDDEHNDALQISEFIEEQVRKSPAQYMWVQKRFKTRPDGEPSLY